MSAHHPDDITLLDYATGTLPLPKALAVSVHLFFCGHCRAQVARLETLGGALLEQVKPASVAADDFDRLMAHIDETSSAEATMSTEATMAAPAVSRRAGEGRRNPLQAYLPTGLQDLEWQQQTRDISRYDLTSLISAKGFRVALQKIRAGARVPTHTHGGTELTVILSGGFSDELGVYHAGDYVQRDASHKHSPTALQNEDCVCLTVLDAPIRFTGWLHRLLNPFMAWR